MATVKDIFAFLNGLAPVETKMDFDNVGFLAGFGGAQVNRIVTALDITSEVVAEATETGAELIVSHHPLFFSLKSVTDCDPTGARVTSLLRNGISAICMHTNLDAAVDGVNDTLARAVGIENAALLTAEGTDSSGRAYSCARWGELPQPIGMEAYLHFLKGSLKTNGLRYYDAGRPVHRLATVGGSGGSYLHDAYEKGCDTLLTADIKYDVFLEAKELGMNLIDGDHFCTENLVVPVLRERLSCGFPEIDVRISSRHSQTACFYR